MGYKNCSDIQRVNATAMFSYSLFIIILIASYFIEVLRKSRTVTYFIIFCILLLIPFVACKILLHADKESEKVKFAIAGGFFVFYLFVIFTTTSPIAYVYAVVVAVILLCYNQNKLILAYMLCVTIANIVQTVVMAINHQIASADMANVEIKIASLILFTLYMTMSTVAAELTNHNRMEQIKTEKERVSKLMDQILNSANQMIESISIVSEKVEILNKTANETKISMEEVTQGTGETADSIQMQMEKTEEIDQAIRHVSDSTCSISDNIGATRDEMSASRINIDELIRHVEISNQSNKNVADEITKLKEYAEKMQSIIELINGVTAQTSLLALNASIEAAHAGEAGKGFAVVAAEISSLSSQTKDATVNITKLIDDISDELTKMVDAIENLLHNAEEQNEVANNTARFFEEITEKIEVVYCETEKLNGLVSDLNSANEQVISGIETVSAVTEEVTAHSSQTLETSEKNSSIASEVQAVVEELSRMANELKEANL